MLRRMIYRRGFVHRLDDVGRLPAITIEATDLPEDVLALLDQHLLDLGGTYGDPNAGDPIQYDEVRIEHERAVKCRTAVRSMGPVVATSLLLVLVGIVLGGASAGFFFSSSSSSSLK